MQVEMARKNRKHQIIITCGPDRDGSEVVNFDPIGTFDMPEYPDLKLYYPPILKMLDFCYTQDFTHIHSATPGPIGLAALAIARILKIPIVGTYHTALPQYVGQLTGDNAMGEIMWKYVVWYYGQMDTIYVPSRATGDELTSKGIHRDKVRLYPRGVDTERFHPSKRNGFFKKLTGVSGSEVNILYVGRVSREKSLPFLVEVFKRLVTLRPNVRLCTIGDGPYLEEMKEALEGLPAVFTGPLEGEKLAQAYASSDLFVFPSTTDTFGNVVLEAQASGLPVIVTEEGGPRENLIEGVTGLVVPPDDLKAFVEALLRLIDSPDLLRRMARNAREYSSKRSFESAYLELWESYREVTTPEACSDVSR
jgi:glycosyltransferase involved in cell wall biosynthesis